MKKNYFLLIMAFCCLFSVTQKSYGQLSFDSTPVTTATVGAPYTYSSFASDGTSNGPAMTCPTKPAWMSFAATGSTSMQTFGPTISAPGGIAGDADGNTYVVQNSGSGRFIYKIAPDGTANTTWAAVDDGYIYAMNVDAGYLYVSYYSNYTTGGSSIKKISLTNPGDGQTLVYQHASQGLLSLVFRGGYIYCAHWDSSTILKIDPVTGTSTVFVSTSNPFGLGFDASGLLYIANYSNYTISTYDGTTLSVILNVASQPTDVKIDANGNVYVSFYLAGGIKKYDATLATETVLVPAVSANAIWGMNLSPTGSLVFGLYRQNTCARIGTGAVLSGTPALSDIGTHNVTIRATTATETVDQSFVVTVQGPPTLSGFPDLNGAVGTNLTLTDPTSNSAGAFTYTSSDPSIATISGNTVTPIAAGTTTITATQAPSGNYTRGTITSVLTVTSCAAPVAITKDIIVQLDAAGNATIVSSDVDNGSTYECGMASMNLDKTTFSCADVGVNTVVLTVTDTNGNSATNTATVTIVDNIDPVFTSVSQINVNTDLDACGAIVTYTKPLVNDNCAGNSNVLLIWDEINSNTTSLQNALIAAGNIVTLSATSETAYNGTNPALTGFDAVVHLNGTTYGTAMPIGGQNAILDFVLNQGKIYVTDEWSAYEADDAGTMAAMKEIIVLKRNNGFTQPTTYSQVSSQASHPILAGVPTSFNLPVAGGNIGFARVYSSNQPIVLMTSSQGDAVAVREFSNGGKAIGFQNAGNFNGSTVLSDVNIQKLYSNAVSYGAIVQLTQTAGLASGSLFPLGTTTNTFTATDGSGNMSTTSFDVVVTDNQLPIIASNGDINVNTDVDTCGATVVVSATATDNCTVGLPTGVRSDSLALDALYPVGTTTITWNVTDANSNAAVEVIQTVVVADNQLPVIVSNGDKNVNTDLDTCGATVVVSATATDNCTVGLPTGVRSDGLALDALYPVGTTTIAWNVTDANNNNAVAVTQTIVVTDIQKPVAITKNITVQLNAAGNATITPADVNNGSTDACGIATLVLDKTSFSCANVGSNTVILTVTDNNGNVATQTAIVTVEDKVAPVVVTKNKTIQLNAAGTASIVVADVNNGSTDNCGISLVELDKMAFTCANVGANTVTLKVTDNNGNVATQTAIITVEDKIAPVVFTKNITVQLDASSNILIAAADVNNGSTDNCGISLLELDKVLFSCADVGENVVTLKVTDNSGNVATRTAIVTIVNSQPNLIRKHFDDVIFFDNSSKAFIAYSWYKNGVLVPGQTAQYFKDSGVLNGTYYAKATKIDGTVVTTCPLTFSASIVDEFLKIAPNPVKSNASYQILTNVDSAKLQNARITVFNILGVLVNDKIVDGKTTDMIAPSTEGIYVVRMTLASGKYFTKNLLVKN